MSNPTFGRYELVRRLAVGGMAELFLARMRGEAGFFHDVVVKRLFRNLTEHDGPRRMFQDEAKLLAALSHPTIPQVYELGQVDGSWYMAMEYIDGYDLSALWQQGARLGRPMPLGVAIGVVMQICEGLHHAHERRDRIGQPLRIVHRDVNPQNMMVTRDGVAKLVDFGIARTTARRDTDANVVKGTYAYMAPEQVKAMPLDKRVDVFALGVVLYELTTGVRLFAGSDVQNMTRIVEEDVLPPSVRVPGYPQGLETVVLSMLRRNRAQRMHGAARCCALRGVDFPLRAGKRSVARDRGSATAEARCRGGVDRAHVGSNGGTPGRRYRSRERAAGFNSTGAAGDP